MTSAWISEGDDYAKQISAMREGLNILEKDVEKNISKLKGQLEIDVIKPIVKLGLESVTIDVRQDNGYYSTQNKIHIWYSNEAKDRLKLTNIEIVGSGTVGFGSNNLVIYPFTEEGLGRAKYLLNSIEETDLYIHMENVKNAKSNLDTWQAVKNLLDRIGIKSTYYGYPSKRSHKKDTCYYNWVSEISNQIPTSYKETHLEDVKKEKYNKLMSIYNAEISKINAEKQKIENEQKIKEENRTLALLLAKYDLDISCEWNDLLDTIIEKNKYLRLAYMLNQNRNNWNDGYSYAENGLNNFKIETELDQKIYDDIHSYFDDFNDGRCFRDCEYNYDILYGIVDSKDLMKDFELVRGKTT